LESFYLLKRIIGLKKKEEDFHSSISEKRLKEHYRVMY
jgi:hypothetical protein